AFIKVNANFWCNGQTPSCEKFKMQIAVRRNLMPKYQESFQLLHTKMHKPQVNRKLMKGNQIIVLTQKRDERILQTEAKVVMTELVAYVDGGCLGNPGPSGIGVVISGCANGPVHIAKWIGHQDNNVAEYDA